MSINEDVGDLVTSHRLWLLRYEAGTTQELLKAYDGAFADVTAEMDRLYAKIQAKESLDYRQLGRLGALKADLTRRIGELHRIAKVSLDQRLTEVAQAERAFVEGRLSRKIGVNLGAVPEEQVALMVASPLGGQRWTDRLAVDLVEAHTDVQRVLSQAIASGQSIPHMAAALRRGTGLVETYRGRFVSIARTEVQRVANDAAMASYALNEDVIGAVQWLATLDSRTCLLCAPRHNTVYPLKDGRAVGMERPPPLHSRCRCFLSPVVKSYDEIGVKVKGDPKGYDGRPAEDTTFDAWLKRQDADTQRDVLGASRYDLWKAGKFDLSAFTENGKVLKVGELVARAKADGIDLSALPKSTSKLFDSALDEPAKLATYRAGKPVVNDYAIPAPPGGTVTPVVAPQAAAPATSVSAPSHVGTAKEDGLVTYNAGGGNPRDLRRPGDFVIPERPGLADSGGADLRDVPGVSGVVDPTVEKQLHDNACGPACAVMLAGDRGVVVDQAPLAARILDSRSQPEVLRKLGGVVPAELAAMLSEVAPGRVWRGGGLRVPGHDAMKLARALASGGSWGALLVPEGRQGHWVVVDGVLPDGTVLARDPAGLRVSLSPEAFSRLWVYTYGVFEEAP